MTIKTRTPVATIEPVTEKPKRKTAVRASKSESKKKTLAQAEPTNEVAKSHSPHLDNSKSEVFLEGIDRPVTGRSVFAVRRLGNTVSVESAFVEEGGNVLRLPAVFPNRQYAMAQIDELRQIVNDHFDGLDKSTQRPN